MLYTSSIASMRKNFIFDNRFNERFFTSISHAYEPVETLDIEIQN